MTGTPFSPTHRATEQVQAATRFAPVHGWITRVTVSEVPQTGNGEKNRLNLTMGTEQSMFCVCATARGGERRPPGQLSAVDGHGAPEEGLWRQAVSSFIQDFTGRRNLGAPLLHSQVS